MHQRRLTTIILAAGEGTRMKSARAKVLHEVAGRALLGHVMQAAYDAGTNKLAVVVGPDREDVAHFVRHFGVDGDISVDIAIQTDRRGTANAAYQAKSTLEMAEDDVLIVFADTPLMTATTFRALRTPLAEGADVVVAAFEPDNPTGYGRVLTQDGEVLAIREENEASSAERAIRLCNGGLMAVGAKHVLALLEKVDNANAKGEFYLTDVVEIACDAGLVVKAVRIDEREVHGVNTRAQLAEAEELFQQRLRAKALEEGVTLVAPTTVYFSYDTKLAADVWVGPHVVFGPGVEIAGPSEILSFCHLAGCKIAKGARIGPFARIRPQTIVGRDVHIGNFVEINRTTLGAEVQANHLSYLGDAEVGEGTNIGAGTITCNFDGANKHRTTIGRDVFVGSNATLVAPLAIGDEVLIAAGSTITKNIAEGALAFGRAKQTDLPEQGKKRVRRNKKQRAERKARRG